MPKYKVVLDTNALLRCISSKSPNAIVLDNLRDGVFELIVTTEILFEYEEKIGQVFSPEVAELILGVFMLLPNVTKTDVHFHLNLISGDVDDNKFTDCGFAGNAHFIVTDDKHFNSIKSTEWPNLTVISLSNFKELLLPPPLTEDVIAQLVR
jgi:uncharacterized protein